ncbi:hypothetical protein CEXT_300801 [Caerostris extrusa]|uniref:Uncharacterized protein n=1 Tax=Caerostris extrusa TaxID=172846 RepID=A0AAV4MQU0_CAEEX|nr:hypothetical protein CEXT_300801 [Caerostris extrusa]
MPAVVDRVYHILLCNQKSYTHPRAQRALPACCFWTCIKAQRGRPRTVVPTDGLSGTCRNYSFHSVDTTVWTKFEPSSETCTRKRTVDEDSMSPSKAMNLKTFFRIVRPSRL